MNAFDRYCYAQRLFRERRYTAAARELELLVNEADDTALGEAPLLLARAYYLSAQLAKAEAAARQLIEADPTDTYAVLLLARTLQRRGRHSEAGTWLKHLDGMGYDTWSDEASPVASPEVTVTDARPAHTDAA